MSQRALAAEQGAPGASADAVVWTDVIERAYDESALTWTFLTFMVLATLLAGHRRGDGLGHPGHRGHGARARSSCRSPPSAWAWSGGVGTCSDRPLRTLAVGFTVSILVTTALAAIARAAG